VNLEELRELVDTVKLATIETNSRKQTIDTPGLLNPLTAYHFETAKKKQSEAEKALLGNITSIENCIRENQRMKEALQKIADLCESVWEIGDGQDYDLILEYAEEGLGKLGETQNDQ